MWQTNGAPLPPGQLQETAELANDLLPKTMQSKPGGVGIMVEGSQSSISSAR
jgi:hypothetical protein